MVLQKRTLCGQPIPTLEQLYPPLLLIYPPPCEDSAENTSGADQSYVEKITQIMPWNSMENPQPSTEDIFG